MNHKSFPSLGKPTKYGYRCSRGFVVNEHGQTVQKFFWLGSDTTKAMLKLTVIDGFAAAVQFSKSSKLT